MENYWQVLSIKFSIIFGLIAAITALGSAIYNTFYNYKKLRWERTKLAFDLVEELFNYEPAFNALRMIDETITYETKTKIKIYSTDVINALNNKTNNDIYILIRECFDGLYYYLDRIERSIDIGIINFEDIESHFAFYSKLLMSDEVYLNYAKFINYEKACVFIYRYK